MVVRECIDVPVKLIDLDKNIRKTISRESLAGLSDSIARHGLHQPVGLMPCGERYKVLFGQRRVLGTEVSGQETIPAIIYEGNLSALDVLLAQLTENLQREDVPDLEKAEAIEESIRLSGGSASHVAKELGVSPTLVSNLRSLLTLPEPIQAHIAAGEIPTSTAAEIARVEGAEAQLRLADEVVNSALTRDAVAGRVRAARRNGAESSPSPSASRVSLVLGGGRSISVSCPSLCLDSGIECLEDALAKARKARTKGIELTALSRSLREQNNAN